MNSQNYFFLSAYDLPQRPNEAQIFYGNMSKVMLCLFGTMEMSDSGESDHTESVRPSQRQTSESDRYTSCITILYKKYSSKLTF